MQASWLQERGRDGNMIEKMVQQGHHLLAEGWLLIRVRVG